MPSFPLAGRALTDEDDGDDDDEGDEDNDDDEASSCTNPSQASASLTASLRQFGSGCCAHATASGPNAESTLRRQGSRGETSAAK